MSGLIFCGGLSSRMGQDKALLELEGRSLLDIARRCLEPLCGELLLSCGPEPRYAHLGLPLVLDQIRGAGPLAGLAAGLESAQGDILVALACDMPRVQSYHLAHLLSLMAESDLDLCLFEGERGVEPLCGVYRSTCLPAVRAALAAGERRMQSFWRNAFDGVQPLRVHLEPLANPVQPAMPLGGPESIINLNTPEDLASERERIRQEKQAP